MSEASLKLSGVKILIADEDLYLSSMLAHALHAFGFSQITRVASARQAQQHLQTQGADILLTEWGLPIEPDYSLVQYIRDPARSPNLLLPMVMITARAERKNVEIARDIGVNEFVVKPFTSAMLFDRIRRLFDHPRDFIISPHFIGPDRRLLNAPYVDANARTLEPVVVSHLSSGIDARGRPVMINKSDDLRKKANLKESIEALVTPALLQQVQQVIFSYQDQSGSWIEEDVRALEKASSLLAAGLEGGADSLKNVCLMIQSRAGVFNHAVAAQVAFSLYSFLSDDYDPLRLSHLAIVKKHVQVIKAMLAGNVLGHDPALQQDLAAELLRMTEKLKHHDGPSDALLNKLNALPTDFTK